MRIKTISKAKNFATLFWRKIPFFCKFLILTLIVLLGIVFLSPGYLDLSGGCTASTSPYLKSNRTDINLTRITYCSDGDKSKAKITSSFFIAKENIQFSYAGYPETNGQSIYLETISGGRVGIKLQNARESWVVKNFKVPNELIGQELRLAASDSSTDSFSWIGIGDVRLASQIDTRNELNWLVTLALVYLATSIILACVLDRVKDENIAVIIFILLVGLFGYISFWLYYLNVYFGSVYSAILIAGFLFRVFFLVKAKNFVSLENALLLLGPVAAYTIFLLVLGYFPFLESSFGFELAGKRWLDLPMDSWLPKVFADQILAGKVESPMVGDWLSSDRPPLQTGIYLLFLNENDFFYQVISTFLQALIFLPLGVLLKQVSDSKSRPYILFGIAITSLVAVNGLFVWPKLISSNFIIIFYLLMLTHIGNEISKVNSGLLAGAAIAMAVLTHGGAIFAVIPIFLFYLARPNLSRMGYCFWVTVVGLCIYSPWIFYQKFIDPPGDRLMKWHLGGVTSIDNSKSLYQVLVESYKAISFGGWLNVRIRNLELIFGGTFSFLQDFLSLLKNPTLVINLEHILNKSFFETFYSFWFFNPFICIFFWLVCGRPVVQKYNNLATLFWVCIGSLFFWSLLMFEPASTVIHQGTFFAWLGLFLISSAIIWRIKKTIFFIFLSINSMIFTAIYVCDVFIKFNWVLESKLTYLITAITSLIVFAVTIFQSPIYLAKVKEKNE